LSLALESERKDFMRIKKQLGEFVGDNTGKEIDKAIKSFFESFRSALINIDSDLRYMPNMHELDQIQSSMEINLENKSQMEKFLILSDSAEIKSKAIDYLGYFEKLSQYLSVEKKNLHKALPKNDLDAGEIQELTNKAESIFKDSVGILEKMIKEASNDNRRN
jgi:hypothetical protein